MLGSVLDFNGRVNCTMAHKRCTIDPQTKGKGALRSCPLRSQLVRPSGQNQRQKNIVAIYHLSVKAVSRSAGRSATAAAAYRAGVSITDERTGDIYDYRRRGGVESAEIVLPVGGPEWATDRAALWNAAELAEKRKDACVAREFEVALPAELSPAARRLLALDFAQDMADMEGCAVDVAIHAPGSGGDNRNHHAHILRTTRKVEADGLGAKLDTEKAGRKRSDDLEEVRARWADLVNAALKREGHTARVDHRSLEAQGIERDPTRHLGPAASGFERRTGEPSIKRTRWEMESAEERLANAKRLGELERQGVEIERSIIDLSNDILAAKNSRRGVLRDEAREFAKEFGVQFRAEREAKRQAEQQRALQVEREAKRKAEIERQREKSEAIERERRVDPKPAEQQIERQPEQQKYPSAPAWDIDRDFGR